MSNRFGCGPLGCLFRLVCWLVFLAVLALVVLAVAVGVLYLLGPRPSPAGGDDFLAASSIGYSEVSIDRDHDGIRAIVRLFSDSIVEPRIAKSVARSPALLRPLTRAGLEFSRQQVLPRATPYAVREIYYSGPGSSGPRPLLAISPRLPISLLKALNVSRNLLDLTSRNRALAITMRNQTYPVQTLDHKSLVVYRNWLLLADSAAVVREALTSAENPSVPEQLRHLRAGLSDTSDVLLVLDNRSRVLRHFLTGLEPKILGALPPAERDVAAYLFGRALPLSDQIGAVAAEACAVGADALQGQVTFYLPSSMAAASFSAFLDLLKRFMIPELAKSRVALDAEIEPHGKEVLVRCRLTGTRAPILHFLKQSFRQ
jgi:hypothetical protein